MLGCYLMSNLGAEAIYNGYQFCFYFLMPSIRPYWRNTYSSPPSDCTLQVELSLQSSFQPGMKLEVANKGSLDTYWVATIITTCGQLLLLRYCGYGDDRKADFWCDVMTAELHPVGWCAQNNKTLQPPEGKAPMHSN